METYIIGASDFHEINQRFIPILANSQNDAIVKFLDHEAEVEHEFIRHIYNKQHILIFINHPHESSSDNFHTQTPIQKEMLVEQVNIFFNEHPDFAEIYLNYYFSHLSYPRLTPFPNEMIRFMWRNYKWSRLIVYKI